MIYSDGIFWIYSGQFVASTTLTPTNLGINTLPRPVRSEYPLRPSEEGLGVAIRASSSNPGQGNTEILIHGITDD